MKIKFVDGDPRAGAVAQMDSIRGQELIDTGAAVRVREDGSDMAPPAADSAPIAPVEPPAAAPPAAPAPEKPSSKRATK